MQETFYYYYGIINYDYGLLAYRYDSLETIKNYMAEKNLNYEIVVPEDGDFFDEEIFYIDTKGELPDLERYKLSEKIYSETGKYNCSYSLEVARFTPHFTVESDYINGDANKDEKLTLADSVAVLQSIANPDKYALSMEGEFNAEVDGVDGITVNDAIILRQWGMENTKGN